MLPAEAGEAGAGLVSVLVLASGLVSERLGAGVTPSRGGVVKLKAPGGGSALLVTGPGERWAGSLGVRAAERRVIGRDGTAERWGSGCGAVSGVKDGAAEGSVAAGDGGRGRF